MTELSYRVDGPDHAPVLVLSNSLGTTTALWDRQVPALSRTLRVVRYDHPGHGRTPPAPGPYTLADLGGDVVALLDRLGVARCSFAGVSLGGMVGMWLAAHAPERIEKLAVCCSSAYLPPPEMWADRAATARAHGTAALADTAAGRWFTPAFREQHPDVVAAAVATLKEDVNGEGYAGCCEAIAAMDLRASLPGIQAPTLVIGGADDPATPPDHHARVIADKVPGAHLEIVEAAAHLANLEQHEPVTRLLLEHFGADAGGRGSSGKALG
jgi:3-oxoadipate enol-lactonase